VKPILDIQSVTKSFGSLNAVDDVSLQVYPGEIFALLGPNGAGKTTLIGCISGLIQRFSGSITVDGFDVRKDYPVVRQLIGLVPQELNFDGFFKTRHVLEYQGGFFGNRQFRERSCQLLEDFSLSDKAESNSRWLSGGMKRRLMICKALTHHPALLFLDEPTAGVDVELRDELWDYVRRLREAGTTIVLTTHYLEEAEELADRIGVINNGKLVLLERRDDLLNHYGERWLEVWFDQPVADGWFQGSGCTRIEAQNECLLRFYFRDLTLSAQNPEPVLGGLLEQFRERGVTPLRIEGGRSRLEDIFRKVVGNGTGTGEGGRSAMRQGDKPVYPDLRPEWVEAAEHHIAEVRERGQRESGLWGTWTLFKKEMHRFLSIAGQTVISPILTTMLWYLVFGYSLGDRLDEINGIPYTDFLVPGLVMMAIITNAFLNSGFSFFIGKVHGTVVDLLVSPLRPWQIALAYTAASVVRAVAVGTVIWAVAAAMGAVTTYQIGWTFLFMVLTSCAFALLGLATGILAKDFDHINFIPSFLLLPMTFLGGVFYSVKLLPDPWGTLSLFNPILYMVNGLRYGMTGVSDVPVLPGVAISAASVLVGLLLVLRLLSTGRGLKP
jgi:ABC-type multidrug transport system ATPase subunit/ABC-type multidrug transport system permease subunit